MFRFLKPNLEQEFEQYKSLHKYSIVLAKAIQYFKDIEADEPQIPDFMRDDNPEAKAKKVIRNILASPNGINVFNNLYETAYQDLAEVLQ